MSTINWTYSLGINPSDQRFLVLTVFKNGKPDSLELVSKLFDIPERCLTKWDGLGMDVAITDKAQVVLDERAKRRGG